MSAIPVWLKCDFSSDFTVIIQQYYQSADKLRFVGSALWMQHLGYEPSHFFTFLHLLLGSCTTGCVFGSRHVNAGREETVADAAPVFTASLCNETGKTQLLCRFIQDYNDWSLGHFISTGESLAFCHSDFCILKACIPALWLTLLVLHLFGCPTYSAGEVVIGLLRASDVGPPRVCAWQSIVGSANVQFSFCSEGTKLLI